MWRRGAMRQSVKWIVCCSVVGVSSLVWRWGATRRFIPWIVWFKNFYLKMVFGELTRVRRGDTGRFIQWTVCACVYRPLFHFSSWFDGCFWNVLFCRYANLVYVSRSVRADYDMSAILPPTTRMPLYLAPLFFWWGRIGRAWKITSCMNSKYDSN